jgi:hypothetical protein
MILLYNPRVATPGYHRLPHSLLQLGALLEGRYPYAIVDGNLDQERDLRGRDHRSGTARRRALPRGDDHAGPAIAAGGARHQAHQGGVPGPDRRHRRVLPEQSR